MAHKYFQTYFQMSHDFVSLQLSIFNMFPAIFGIFVIFFSLPPLFSTHLFVGFAITKTGKKARRELQWLNRCVLFRVHTHNRCRTVRCMTMGRIGELAKCDRNLCGFIDWRFALFANQSNGFNASLLYIHSIFFGKVCLFPRGKKKKNEWIESSTRIWTVSKMIMVFCVHIACSYDKTTTTTT